MCHYRLVSTLLLAGSALISFAVNAAVLTSIKPLAFISAAITDGVTQTDVLLPDGASPHTYALRPSDIKRLRDAELVVWIGKDMEVFLDKPLQSIAPEKKLTLTDLKSIDVLLLKNTESSDHDHDHDHDHGATDMHIWLSPVIAKQIATELHHKLVGFYPTQKAILDANLQFFIQELEQGEQNVGRMLQPLKGKGYFVFHDAYQYFEHYFGLTQSGHFTINPEIQPGAQKLHQIRTTLVKQNVQCVFAEPQFKPAIIGSVTQGLKVKQGILDPMGTNIKISKESYLMFMNQLSSQFKNCLKDET